VEVVARKRASSDSDPNGPVGLGELLSFGALFLCVVGVLALAAFLKTESPPAHPSALPAPTVSEEPELAPEQPVAPTRAGGSAPRRSPAETPPPVVGTDLLRRTQDDLQRFSGGGDPWTLQLALLCDPGGAREAVDRFGAHAELHVLPSLHDDRACFVLTWNRYGTREAAKTARDLPAAVRSSYPGAFPKAVAEVLR
jgi:hypothetical protein